MNRGHIGLSLLYALLLCLSVEMRTVIAQTPPVQLLDANNEPLTALIDGNAISLKISLPQAVSADTPIDFTLADMTTPLATCTVPTGQTSCQTELFPTFGWAWGDGATRPIERVVRAYSAEIALGESATLTITPRPVVLVHGFAAEWEVWAAYLGTDGFLTANGLRGFAVDDGQVAGVMNIGKKSTPLTRTNTIAQNAEALGEYIGNVQQATGAEQVDLLVHSMGGIIARYYVDRLMPTRNVAQLILLGSPMGGSSCSILPAALGLMLPASLELQPGYMQRIFNPQITHRNGVPFHALAGTQLVDAVQSPCTDVPSDLVVPIASVKAIAMPVQEMALLHPALNDDPVAFSDFVLPLLQTAPGDFWQVADPPLLPPPTDMLQFTGVYTGHLQPGETQSVTINIDPGVTVATFALYDTSRSLTTTVTGANGNTLQLDPVANGEIRVTDPDTMIYLGYGFVQPKAGQWIVTLKTTDDTPAAGADYAITAQLNGGATLQTRIDTLLPQVNKPVTIQTQLMAAGQGITIISAQARLRRPDGHVESYPLLVEGESAALTLTPAQSGLYGVEINVRAQTAAGLLIDRATSSIFEAQPTPATGRFSYDLLLILLLALILLPLFILPLLLLLLLLL